MPAPRWCSPRAGCPSRRSEGHWREVVNKPGAAEPDVNAPHRRRRGVPPAQTPCSALPKPSAAFAPCATLETYGLKDRIEATRIFGNLADAIAAFNREHLEEHGPDGPSAVGPRVLGQVPRLVARGREAKDGCLVGIDRVT